MKNKETLEEVAERIYREYPNNPLDKPDWRYNRDVNCFKKRKAFIAGAKWQQERMYSEEEVIELLNKREDCINQTSSILDYTSAKEWFEKFKKK